MARVVASAKKNPKLWRKEFTCTGKGWMQHGTTPCGQLIEVLGTDICSRLHTDYGGGTDEYFGFYCPSCGSFTEIPTNKIPYEIRSMASKKRR